MLELDVLVAQALKLTLEELLSIYRVQFPVLQQNERDTWYDKTGKIVFTCNVGLSGSAFGRKSNRNDFVTRLRYPDGRVDERRIGWENLMPIGQQSRVPNDTVVERTIIDDTQPNGPVRRVVEYVAPFSLANREDDYRVAWAHFKNRQGEN